MKIVIDINHPGHVHYFKHTIKYLIENNHKIIVVAREREFVGDLLRAYNIPYINRGKGKNTLIGKVFYLFLADFKYLRILLKFNPDLLLSFSTPYIHQVGWFMRIPSIALNDTEHTDKIHSKLTYPFSTSIITPSCYQNNLGNKQIRINCFIENLYLNKKYFVQNNNIFKMLRLKTNDQYVILRFVSWNAHHDIGQFGLDIGTKRELINLLKKRFKIFISSEQELPEEFKKYKIKIEPDKMHDVLANASLFIGESATMASESSLLGTSSVYINSLPLMGYLSEEQNAGLLKHFVSSKGVIDYVQNLMKKSNLKLDSQQKSKELQKDFIDPTKFLIWFIEEYPNSVKIIKKNPAFQRRFL